MSDEDGLASPLDNDLRCLSCCSTSSCIHRETHVLALGDSGEIDLNLGLGQNVGGGGHVDEEVCWAQSLAVRSSSIRDPNHLQNSQLLSTSSEYAASGVSCIFHPSAGLSHGWGPTLDSRLRAKRTQRTHGSDHEVLEEAEALRVCRAVVPAARATGIW